MLSTILEPEMGDKRHVFSRNEMQGFQKIDVSNSEGKLSCPEK